MRKAKPGDLVLVHYVKRFGDGAEASSRVRGADPLEVTVGAPHPRLPGLGRGLVGLTPGEDVVVAVPPGRAVKAADPARVARVDRSRFPADRSLAVGSRVRLTGRSGRVRSGRVVVATDRVVVVDLNHPRAGQGVELRVELVAFLAPAAGPGEA